MHRRHFLSLTAQAGLGLAAMSLPGCTSTSGLTTGSGTDGAAAALRPGLQLFTVMTLLDRDFEATLKAVRDIGYRSVETVGAFDRDPAQVADLFAKYGLSSPSQHLMPGGLYGDFSLYNRGGIGWDEIVRRFATAFDFAAVDRFIAEAISRANVLGQRFIVWQTNWQKHYGLAEVKQHIAAFNRAGRLCADAGLQFAVHNHDLEFAMVDGMPAYDRMVQETDPVLVKLEMDFMWATAAGVDPVAYFKRYPGRFRMTHLKDRTADGKIAIPGMGVEDFPRLIAASRAAGIEHAFVEFDQPTDALREIGGAWNYLTALPGMTA